MAPRLILNADDFGLTPGINRAIAELHAAGCLTSATLMANGPAFDDAVAHALANPSLGIGCHVVLTDGIPVSPADTIPTLLGPDRRTFRPSLPNFIRDVLLGRISEAEIEREATAQIARIQATGIRVTHVDTHKHTHIFPPVARAIIRAMKATSVPAIRNPFEPAGTPSHARPKRRLEISLLHSFQPAYTRAAEDTLTTDGTFGISATGNLNQQTLSEILHTLPNQGTFELLCHPGYNDSGLDAVTTRLRHHRQVEMRALLDQIPEIFSRPNPPQLIHYGDIVSTPTPAPTPSKPYPKRAK
jgi:predicted glycoside hydrolase/deacetylase ChbG (UPF0249 family)